MFSIQNSFEIFPKITELTNPAVVAEWLKALFPNKSRESNEGPKFKSHLRHVYVVPHNLL